MDNELTKALAEIDREARDAGEKAERGYSGEDGSQWYAAERCVYRAHVQRLLRKSVEERDRADAVRRSNAEMLAEIDRLTDELEGLRAFRRSVAGIIGHD